MSNINSVKQLPKSCEKSGGEKLVSVTVRVPEDQIEELKTFAAKLRIQSGTEKKHLPKTPDLPDKLEKPDSFSPYGIWANNKFIFL